MDKGTHSINLLFLAAVNIIFFGSLAGFCYNTYKSCSTGQHPYDCVDAIYRLFTLICALGSVTVSLLLVMSASIYFCF